MYKRKKSEFPSMELWKAKVAEAEFILKIAKLLNIKRFNTKLNI